jgi:hypothetical protein
MGQIKNAILFPKLLAKREPELGQRKQAKRATAQFVYPAHHHHHFLPRSCSSFLLKDHFYEYF